MKTIKTKSIFFLILFLSFIFVSVSFFSPTVSANTTTTNISAGDIIKNFRFASIGDEPIVNRGAFNNKLRFEKQEAWTLNRDTIIPIDCYSVPIEGGGFESYLRYKIEARTRVNIFTNLLINQVSETFFEDTEDFLAGTYNHYGLFGHLLWGWEECITWNHWDFGGSIKEYNARENVFSGPISMEFDISASPLPDVFGDYAVNDWAYITVDSAGVIYNEMGDMSSDELPETVTLSPSVYDSELRSEYTQTDEKTKTKAFDVKFDPMTQLSDPFLTETFAEGIIPQGVGSSLSPKNLDGTLPWDPNDPSGSMTGCRLEYDLNSLSPKVRKMSARLVYYEITLSTQDVNVLVGIIVFVPIFEIRVQERYFNDAIRTYDRDVALQVVNRFLQTEIRVVFDIWTKVNIGALTPYYEQMKLAKPEEFYEELIWSSMAGGWGGSYQRTTPPDWYDINPIFIIITIIIIVVVIFVVFKVIRGKQKAIGTVMFGRSK